MPTVAEKNEDGGKKDGKIRIAIEVSGGVVNTVRSSHPDIEVELFDYDDQRAEHDDEDEPFEAEEPDLEEYPYEIF